MTNIGPVANLTQLEFFHIGSNNIIYPVTDLSPLQNLVNLTEFHAYTQQISDISVLAGLPELTIVDLRNNQTLVNITPLGSLQNIEQLDLRQNAVDDVSSLCNWPNTSTARILLNGNPLSNSQLQSLRSCLPDATILF